VVGAGPAGLILASGLLRYGLSTPCLHRSPVCVRCSCTAARWRGCVSSLLTQGRKHHGV